MLEIVLISYPHRYNIFPQYIPILFTFVFNENIMKDNNNGLLKPIFFKIFKKTNTVYMWEIHKLLMKTSFINFHFLS